MIKYNWYNKYMGKCFSKKIKNNNSENSLDIYKFNRVNKFDSINSLEIKYFETHKHLICDDISTNRMILGRYLNRFDCDYDEATNGYEVIELIKKGNHYDIIWIDVKMPKMDGIACTKILRNKFNYKGYIIGLTGFADKETVKDCYDSGMDYVKIKPLNKEIILMYIDKVKNDIR